MLTSIGLTGELARFLGTGRSSARSIGRLLSGARRAKAAAALALLIAAAAPAPATAAPPDPTQDRSAATMDPGAAAALTAMGHCLASLKSFRLSAETTVEAVLRAGHQVEIGGTVQYWVKRPDRVRIDAETDTLRRSYIFDGKTFTVVAPEERFFAQTAGKGTARDTLAFAAQELDIELPLVDLFEWTTPEAALKHFQRGFYVGAAKIGGVPTQHYALIGRDVDFEVWIKSGDTPLPLKMAIVDRRAAGNPRFSARLAWSPDEAIPDEAFAFAPAKDLVRIAFKKIEPARKGDQ